MCCFFVFSLGSSVPPDSTSTPRSSNSFAAYARDILARNERHIQTIVARSNTTDDQDSHDHSYDHVDLSLSGTPSSLASTDLDSFLDTTSSTRQSTPRFTTSRPISSQDIKARIARRLLERSKTKKWLFQRTWFYIDIPGRDKFPKKREDTETDRSKCLWECTDYTLIPILSVSAVPFVGAAELLTNIFKLDDVTWQKVPAPWSEKSDPPRRTNGYVKKIGSIPHWTKCIFSFMHYCIIV